MLSEEERREMREVAASATVREEFERIRAASRRPVDHPLDFAQFLKFLTLMTRLGGDRLRPRPFVRYTRVLL